MNSNVLAPAVCCCCHKDASGLIEWFDGSFWQPICLVCAEYKRNVALFDRVEQIEAGVPEECATKLPLLRASEKINPHILAKLGIF